MKKSILTIAMATISVAAIADVTLYGKVTAGVEVDTFPSSSEQTAGSVQDFGSYFGLRGTDPVYGETAAIWQVEQSIDTTQGQAYQSSSGGGMIAPRTGSTSNTGYISKDINTLASSETYLGLQGEWGMFRIGNLSNYARSNGIFATDIYNSANGAEGFQSSRIAKIMPASIRFDTSSWNGLSGAAMYSFGNTGAPSISGIGSNLAGNVLNGQYVGGSWNFGLDYNYGNFQAALSSQLWPVVGAYNDGLTHPSNGVPMYSAAYNNAYADRLEVGYEDPDGILVGAAFQVTNGLGWNSWPTSGGSMNNISYNQGYNVAGLQTNAYQTQEISTSVAYHMGAFMPKIGYSWGNNLMQGSGMLNLITGSGTKIASTGYNQANAELDWNITPRTIVFINYGQVWWGSTLRNIAYVGPSNGGPSNVSTSGSFMADQSSFAFGLSHTF